MSNCLLIFVAILLVLLNGFFVAAEFALVKLRQTRVKSLAASHGWRGHLLAKVHSRLDAYLSACQLGITLASLALGWIGEPAFARLLEPLFLSAGIPTDYIHLLAFGIAFFTISFLHIVIGELVPKSMALQLPDSVSVWTAAPLYGFYWLMYPLIWVLNQSAGVVLKRVGLKASSEHESHYSADELKLILRASLPTDEFTQEDWKVLAASLDVNKLDVIDLMRPINELVAISNQHSLEHNLQIMLQHRFSRYPYLDAHSGSALGIVHVKDVFLGLHQHPPITDLVKIVRPLKHVSPSLPAMTLFRQFREGMPHLALVGDIKHQPLGFITFDNLLGALVGEIRDEFLHSRNDWMRLDDGTLIGKGSLPLFTLERALGISIDNEDVDSIGGLIMWQLGSLPQLEQRICFDEFDAIVTKLEGPRILQVRIHPKAAHEDGQSELSGG
jgi:CBS domain containing-hemolysin-like protein